MNAKILNHDIEPARVKTSSRFFSTSSNMFTLLPILLFAFSCNSKSSSELSGVLEYKLQPIKKYEFNSGFASWDASTIETDSGEYISFVDFVTAKKFVIYSMDNLTDKFTIQLDTLISKETNLGYFSFINLDSILILSKYSNKLFLINRTGQIVNQVNLSAHSAYKGDLQLGGISHFIDKKGNLLFGADLIYEPNGINYKDPYEYLVEKKKMPFMVKVSKALNDSINLEFGLQNFYSNFVDSHLTTIEPKRIYIANDRVFINSFFCDTIYEINTDKFEITNKFKIESKHTKLGYTPVTFDESYNTDRGNQLGQTQGVIYSIHYYKKKNVFLIVTKHEIPIEDAKVRRRPWSILIYDTEFHKLDELKMDETKYSPLLITSEKGILICDYLMNENDDDIFLKSTYELFDLVEK